MYDAQSLGNKLLRLYPFPLMRGKRTRRDQGTQLGEFRLDTETAEFLGSENLGILIHECGKLERVIHKLRQLDESIGDGVWVVVFDRADILRHTYGIWHESQEENRKPPRKIPASWRGVKMMFATPESLKQVLCEIEQQQPFVAAILVLDWGCNIHRARGHATMDNDRPQHIVNFRAAVSHDGWSPPLMLLIDQVANSVDMESIRNAYQLEAFWYVDGKTLSCKPLPEASDHNVASTQTSPPDGNSNNEGRN